MSQRAVSWVLKDSPVDEGVLRLTLVVLASGADDDGAGRMTYAKIAHRARISEPRKALAILVARSVIEGHDVRGNRHHTFEFKIPIPDDYRSDLRHGMLFKAAV